MQLKIANRLNTVNSLTLMKEPKRKHRWLIDNLLFTAGTSLLAGKQKVGKTTLVRQLALEVAKGTSFLNRKVRKGLVLYLALEDDKDEIKDHLERLNSIGEDNLIFHIGSIIGDPFEALAAYIAENKPVLVIVDTLFKFTKIKDLNNYAMVVERLDPLTNLARDNDCHLLFVHHMNKGLGAGQDKILGSVALLGCVDTIITLTTRGEARYLETLQRYGISMPKHSLKFNPETKTYNLDKKVSQSQDLLDEVNDKYERF